MNEGQLLESILDRWTTRDLQAYLKDLYPDLLPALKDTCPECRKRTLTKTNDDMTVCRSCGLVVEEQASMVRRLPFDETYALTANLSHGRSMGNTLAPEDLYKVIAMSKNGRKDLPIRAIHVRTVTMQVELSQSMRLKEEISALLKKYGLYSREYREENHLFADQCGILAERVGRFLASAWMRPPTSYKSLAVSIVVLKLRESPRMVYLANYIQHQEEPDEFDLTAVSCFKTCPFLQSPLRSKQLSPALKASAT